MALWNTKELYSQRTCARYEYLCTSYASSRAEEGLTVRDRREDIQGKVLLEDLKEITAAVYLLTVVFVFHPIFYYGKVSNTQKIERTVQ